MKNTNTASAKQQEKWFVAFANKNPKTWDLGISATQKLSILWWRYFNRKKFIYFVYQLKMGKHSMAAFRAANECSKEEMRQNPMIF